MGPSTMDCRMFLIFFYLQDRHTPRLKSNFSVNASNILENYVLTIFGPTGFCMFLIVNSPQDFVAIRLQSNFGISPGKILGVLHVVNIWYKGL